MNECFLHECFLYLAIRCTPAEPNPHSQNTGSTGSVAVGDNVVYRCLNGYHIRGDPSSQTLTTTCEADNGRGMWSKAAPLCEGKLSFVLKIFCFPLQFLQSTIPKKRSLKIFFLRSNTLWPFFFKDTSKKLCIYYKPRVLNLFLSRLPCRKKKI